MLKPRIAATAHGTFLLTSDSLLATGAQAIQRERRVADETTSRRRGPRARWSRSSCPRFASGGEVSLVYAGGAFSHAVVKRAKDGDFRVQKDFGGAVEPFDAVGRRCSHSASRSWRTCPASCAYARVDVVDSARGPLLMELELIEPELYFSIVPGSAERMARSDRRSPRAALG